MRDEEDRIVCYFDYFTQHYIQFQYWPNGLLKHYRESSQDGASLVDRFYDYTGDGRLCRIIRHDYYYNTEGNIEYSEAAYYFNQAIRNIHNSVTTTATENHSASDYTMRP